MLLASKITSKFQTTIPQKIRKFLGIKNGDAVKFTIKNNNVIIDRIDPIDFNFYKSLNSSLEEWNSKEDDELFSNL